jgi:hypothetical protein
MDSLARHPEYSTAELVERGVAPFGIILLVPDHFGGGDSEKPSADILHPFEHLRKCSLKLTGNQRIR